ncbi:unnamed protein product [Effrenium voratum]|nr:unnamed protein product [Effrenium voratum]
MRPFFTTPLAALSAAYLTWMVMEKQPGAGPEPDVHLPGEPAPSLPAATCDVQTEQPEKRDEFQELVLSGRRSWAILQDLGCFALYSTAEKIWPWPLDFNGTELVQDQLAHLPLQELREAAEAARHGVSELLAPLAEAAAPLLQELRQTSGKAFHDFMETFLEAYPQHRASLKGPLETVLDDWGAGWSPSRSVGGSGHSAAGGRLHGVAAVLHLLPLLPEMLQMLPWQA